MKNINKNIRILAIIAIAQLLFVFVSHVGGSTLAQHANSENMLIFDKSHVDRLQIKGKHHAEVTLIKKEGSWKTQAGFPVNKDKVKHLLDKLDGLKQGLPVATSDHALKRFKVSEDTFERLITLKQGEKKLAALYLGSSVGARQTHARSDSQTAVYTVDLGAYDAPAKVEDWYDKNLLKLGENSISQITLAGITFKRDASANHKEASAPITIWKTDKLPAKQIVNQKAINDSLSSLASLTFSKVLGMEKKAEYGLDKPVLTFSVTSKDKQRDYQVGKLKDKDDYVLKVSDRDEYFQIASYTAKLLVERMKKDKWLIDMPEPVSQPAATFTNQKTPVDTIKTDTQKKKRKRF